MLGNLGRRLFEAVVAVFALLGFAFVPLGSRTGIEHCKNLLSTPAAQEAKNGLIAGFERAKDRLLELALGSARGTAPLPLPKGSPSAPLRPIVPVLPSHEHSEH